MFLRRALALAFVVQFLVACQAGIDVARIAPLPGIPEQAMAVRQMHIDLDSDGDMDTWCTAWHSGSGLWVTAAHCVDRGYLTIDGFPAMGPPFVMPDQDVATISFPVAGPALPLAEELPRFGDRVHYIGYPASRDGKPRYGVYDGRYNMLDTSDGTIMFSAMVDGGASGSPLINEAGEVIGVVVSSFRGTLYSFAEPLVQQ